MQKHLRRRLIHRLWLDHLQAHAQTQIIHDLVANNSNLVPLDHFAVIDLPSLNSGIKPLTELFSILGFTLRGRGYLADKQNDFAWLAEEDADEQLAHASLPQIVIADFRWTALPEFIQKILTRYTEEITPLPLTRIKQLVAKANNANDAAYCELELFLRNYFSGRAWSTPTLNDYATIAEFNELLAWVLIFGRKPNHFTLAIHLMQNFNSLPEFLKFISQNTQLILNTEGGIIKGGEHRKIAQASTQGHSEQISIKDGVITVPTSFVEFVWRYPIKNNIIPKHWKDFFTGFISDHANFVIESLV